MIHWVYPHDSNRWAAPWSIGNEVAARLRAAGHPVTQYDWMDRRTIVPSPGDVLIGHPHPEPGFILRNSVAGPWRKRIAVSPWNGDPVVADRLRAIAREVDDLLLVCGPHWASQPPCPAHTVDIATDAARLAPPLRRWNPPGRRRFLYIGCCEPSKGTDLLEAIIARCSGVRFGHLGPGRVAGCEEYGYLPIEHPATQALIQRHDVLLCPGRHDANPTVALEAALLGLVPVCTETSGWRSWAQLPTDPDAAAVAVEAWNNTADLGEHSRCAQVIAGAYTWERFMRPVLEVLR